MALYARLIGTERPKIPIHAFMAALGEIERGKMTAADAITAFALSAAEQTEAATLIAKIVTPVESYPLASRVILTNLGTTPLILAATSIEGAGVTGVDFRVFLNRNAAASTLTFQIADATSSVTAPTNIVTVTDTATAGDKMISGSTTFGAPLAAGLRHLVFRGNAGNATDDPILLGATLLVRRVSILTADVFHQILLLGETGVAPLNTVAAIQTRLGV